MKLKDPRVWLVASLIGAAGLAYSLGQPGVMPSSYTHAWIVWIAQFAATEGPALVRKEKGDTFTEHWVKWFSLEGKSTGWRIRRIVSLSAGVWITVHFATAGRFI